MRLVVPSLCLIAAGMPAAETSAVGPSPTVDSNPLVVTADRQETDAWRSTAVIDVVTTGDIHDRGSPPNAYQLVAGLPGVDAVGLYGGVDGGVGSIRLRGSPAEDTLILVDGIPLHDASTIQETYNLAAIDGGGLAGIEVVRGAQSGLYGSGAAGGVVNFLTVRPTADHEARARAEGGSFATGRIDGSATGPLGDAFGYALAVGGLHSDGISARTDSDDGASGDHERDAVDRGSLTGRIETTAVPGTRLYVAARGEAVNQDYDSTLPVSPYSGLPDDDRSIAKQRTMRGSTGGQGDWDRVHAALDLARTRAERTYADPGGEASYVGTESWAAGRLGYQILRPAAQRTAIDRASLTVGADARWSRAEIDDQRYFSAADDKERLRGAYAQALVGGDLFDVSGTGRRDDHSEAGRADTGRLGAAVYPIATVKLHGSMANAFRAPSLYELYDAYSGNPDLEPQRSKGYDAGVDVLAVERLTLSAAAFRTDYGQAIGYGVAGYENTGGYRVEGVETAVAWSAAGDGPFATASWTWQRSDLDSQEIAGLPKQKGLLQPGWRRGPVWGTLRLEATGSRPIAGTELPGYALLGAAAGWHVNRTWEVYARGENLLDKDYVVNPGYSTPGIAGYAGVTAAF